MSIDPMPRRTQRDAPSGTEWQHETKGIHRYTRLNVLRNTNPKGDARDVLTLMKEMN